MCPYHCWTTHCVLKKENYFNLFIHLKNLTYFVMLFRETKIIFIKSLGTISGVYWVSQTSNRFLLITRNTDFLLEIQGISDIENIKIPNVKITTSWCHNITASQLTPNSVTYVTKQFLSQFMGLDVDCHSADLSFSAMLYTGNNLFQLN